MKILQKYIYWLICTIALFAVVFYCLPSEEDSLPRFYAESEYGSAELVVHIAEDGLHYVFLPSYTDMEHITISVPSGHHIVLNGTPLQSGMDCGNFALETPYLLETDGQQTASLLFYQSANVATLYIDTASGHMQHIYKNQEHSEYASVSLYTADGTIDHQSENNFIKGRGNSTWDYEKRPFLLTFPTEQNLLGMGAATDWVLLANATDETNLRNSIVLDLAAKTGCGWVPEHAYVDVYLNGEYNGLYLLTEKVEATDQRLNLDTRNGEFLCKFDLNRRWESLQNPFLTAQGRTVEVSNPEGLTSEEMDRITALVNELEQTVLSGGDLSTCANIDLDSWIRRYLIDEISANIDADLTSSYFYYTDGTFYAGPVWDYDMTFGNSARNQNPISFIAKNEYKLTYLTSPFYHALYSNPSFYSRMVSIYQTEYLPVLKQLLEEDFLSLSADIASASHMNSVRWFYMFDSLYAKQTIVSVSTDALWEYLEQRISFLTDVWVDGAEYCTLQFTRDDSTFWNTSVKKGTCLEAVTEELENTVWVDANTGERFDFQQPVTENRLLTQSPDYAKESDSAEEIPAETTTRDILDAAILVFIVLLFLVFGAVDMVRRIKERSRANANSGTKISP